MDTAYLINFDSTRLSYIQTDVLVIGSGIAGLRAAIEASRYAKRVLIVTKSTITDSNTYEAQGGIAVAVSALDSPHKHYLDTLKVGCKLCNNDAVKIMVDNSKGVLDELIKWGAIFDKDIKGDLSLTKEAGHSRDRIIHSRGDAIGKQLHSVLYRKLKDLSNIRVLTNCFAIDVLCKDNRCFGVLAYFKRQRQLRIIYSNSTIMATGGAGQVYRETTNNPVATGDGIAMAYRANAVVVDMEFMQFHPTTLYIAGAARILISETVRGEGGILRNKANKRFMHLYHPDAELAPRDIVSRAIVDQMKKTKHPSVFLDLRHLKKDFLKSRFPTILSVCESFGIDCQKDLLPVRPTAHYLLGGILVDLDTRTSILGLYAAGECACCGLHGANRLASNSLLEGLVFGKRAGYYAATIKIKPKRPKFKITSAYAKKRPINVEDVKASIRSLMVRSCEILRNKKDLNEAIKKCTFWSSYVLKRQFNSPSGWELQNILIVAELMLSAALIRTESRGVHYRTDFPKENDSIWDRKHIFHIKDKAPYITRI